MDNRVKGVIFFGKAELARILMFETAIHLAEQGDSVLYISSKQWQELPAIFHDREQSNADSLKRIKFMYLSDYEELVDKIVDLHTFSTIPTVLIIDNLDHYSKVINFEEPEEICVAKLCAITIYSLNNCAQSLKLDKIKFCTTTSSDENRRVLEIYFHDFWSVVDDGDNEMLVTNCDDKSGKFFRLKKLEDNTLILKEFVSKCV